jgi:hypothetical protein
MWVLAAGTDTAFVFVFLLLLIVCVLVLSVGAVRAFLARRSRSKDSTSTPDARPQNARPQIVGEARKIQWRQDVTGSGQHKVSTAVCTFRIERFDEQGNPHQPVVIEIGSRHGFAGDLAEGDRVWLYEQKRAVSGAVVAGAVRNLSTGGIFGAKGSDIDVPPPA